MIYEHNFEIKVSDLNKNLELKNKSLLSFLEEIGNLQSSTIGLGINDIPNSKLSWVLLNWKVEVIKRPVYGNLLNIKSWERGANKLHCFREYEVYDDKTGELLVRATSKWALLNIETSRPVMLLPTIPEGYAEDDKFAFSSDFPKKIIEPKQFEKVSYYTVKRSNIDFNNHTHNLEYLDIAYESLPEGVFENTVFNNIEIMYKKETKLNDILKCFYTFENGEHIVSIRSEDEAILHTIIKIY